MGAIKKTENMSLNICKIFFAYLIMLNHIFLQYNYSFKLQIMVKYIVSIAVPFFFMSSGYYFFCKLKKEGNKREVYVRYLKKITIMYCFWNIMMLPFRILESSRTCVGMKEIVLYWVKYLRRLVFIGDYQLWYLLGLVQTVLLFWAFYRNGKIRNCYIVVAILLILKILIIAKGGIIVGERLITKLCNMYYIPFGTLRNGIFEGFPFFTIGCFFANNKEKIDLHKVSLALMSGVFLVIGFFVYKREMNELNELTSLISVSLLFLFLINVRLYTGNKIVRKMSSWIYVSHMFFVLLFEYLFGIRKMIIEVLICFLIVTLIGLIKIKNAHRSRWINYIG